MTYVKLDDGFFRNPKVVGVGPEARLLYLAGLCYCSSSLTDGLIPSRAVRVLAAECEADDPIAAVAQLLDAGLWEEDEGGAYRVHDYLDHNRSKAEIAEISAKRSLAGSKGGRPPTNGKANGKQIANRLPEQRKSKRNPDTDTDTDTDTDKGVTPLTPQPSKSKPFDVLVAVCEELGQDVSILGDKERSRQCGFAKQLVEADVGPDEARRMVRWLTSQNWVMNGGGVDLRLMAGQLEKWKLAGRPDKTTQAKPPVPINPGVLQRGSVPKDAGMADWKSQGRRTS